MWDNWDSIMIQRRKTRVFNGGFWSLGAHGLIINHRAGLQYVLSVRRWLRRGTARGEEAEQRSCID